MKRYALFPSQAGWTFPAILAVSVLAHAGLLWTKVSLSPRLPGSQDTTSAPIEVALIEMPHPVIEEEQETAPPAPEEKLTGEIEPPAHSPEPPVANETVQTVGAVPPTPQPPESVLPVQKTKPMPRSTPQQSHTNTATPRSKAASSAVPTRPLSAPRFVEARPDSARNPAPRYPDSARRAKKEGRVTIRATVNTDGRVVAARVQRSSGHDVLDRAALDAVRRWKFHPRTVNGQPQPGEVDVPVNFFLTMQ